MPFFLKEVIMENEMLMNLFWFLGGAIGYKFLSYVFSIGISLNLFTQTLISCLIMIKKIDEQAILSLTINATLLKKEGLSNEEIENIKQNKYSSS